jgi:hypothetical protein
MAEHDGNTGIPELGRMGFTPVFDHQPGQFSQHGVEQLFSGN